MIRFRVFGFPVRIHLSFLLILALLLGSRLSSVSVALWGVSILASVMLHELGHAAAVRRFGGQVESISIYALGGATMWREGDSAFPGWKQFLVAAAGSGVGLFAGLGLYMFVRLGGMGEAGRLLVSLPWRIDLRAADYYGEYLVFMVGSFIWVSVVWGLVNWLPIGGLDGSKMLRAVLVKSAGPERGPPLPNHRRDSRCGRRRMVLAAGNDPGCRLGADVLRRRPLFLPPPPPGCFPPCAGTRRLSRARTTPGTLP